MRRRDFLHRSAVVSVPFLLEGCGLTLPTTSVPVEPKPEDPWLTHFDVDARGLSQVLDALESNGNDFGEIYFQDRSTAALRWNSGTVLTRSRDAFSGAGLRVVKGGQSGFHHTDVLDAETLTSAALAAAAGLETSEPGLRPDGGMQFSRPGSAYRADDVTDSLEQREDIASRLEALIREAEPGTSEVDINLTVTDEWVLIATLDGRLLADRRPMFRLSAQAVMTRDGETHSGFAALSSRQTVEQVMGNPNVMDEMRQLAHTVVERTRRLFDSRRPPEGQMPVILAAGSGGALLHEAVAHAFEADFVREGQSRIGQPGSTSVASTAVTLVDDATEAFQRGSLNIDDEGEAGRRTVLVEQGRLNTLLYDQREALAAGVSSTGSGRRASYAFEPLPRATCTSIQPGTAEPDAMVDAMGQGIIAETIIGGAGEPGGGAFQFRIKHGWYVEGGRRSVPVRDFLLTGNGLDMLRDIRQVANDQRFDTAGWTSEKKGQSVPVSQGTPSILVSSLGVTPLS